MKQLIEFKKELKIGKTNVEYEKIFNCRVIKPLYEVDTGLYNAEFFLDKRYGLEQWVDGDFEYTDDIKILGNTYYLYHNDTEMYVGVESNNTIKTISGPFNYNSKNPVRFAKGIAANGELKESNITITNGATFDNSSDLKIINEDAVYEDGYIVLDVGLGLNIQAGDMVLFKDNVYKGATLEIDLYENGKIYVIGIDAKGSIPINGDTISIYKETGICPVIGSTDGVHVIHIDGTNVCDNTNVLQGDIEDVISFNEALFVLKNGVLYNSSKTNDDTVQFYSSSDRRRVKGAYKLLSKGKFLILLGDVNKLITTSIESNTSFGEYSMYSINYEGSMYSKYSFLFTDTSLYLLQSDKKLVHINLNSLNATAFNLSTDSITKTVRGLMSDIDSYDSLDKGEVFMNDNGVDGKIHILYQHNDGTTTEYEYDKEYNHWLLNSYKERIYKISNRFLCSGHVCNINGYTDLGETYKQDINFTVSIPAQSITIGLIRTIMGITNDFPLRYDLDIDVEASHSKYSKHIGVKNMTFDTMPIDHSLDMLNVLSNGKSNKHNGNIASIQRRIMMTGRYHRYKFSHTDRFIYGYSYLIGAQKSIYTNERNFSR